MSAKARRQLQTVLGRYLLHFHSQVGNIPKELVNYPTLLGGTAQCNWIQPRNPDPDLPPPTGFYYRLPQPGQHHPGAGCR
jgi:hypothetical protein